MNMDFICKLPIPKLIKEEYPISEKAAEIKAKRDAESEELFRQAIRKLEEDTEKLIENTEKEAKKKKKKEISE